MLFFGTKCWFFMVIHINSCKNWKSNERTTFVARNNNFVENQQQWCFVAPHIIYTIRIIQKPIRCFAHFFDSCFGRIPWEFTKEEAEMLFFSKFPRNPSKTWVENVSKAFDRFLDDPDAINDWWSNKASMLLVFNKTVVFRQQMLFFPLISNFCMNLYE